MRDKHSIPSALIDPDGIDGARESIPCSEGAATSSASPEGSNPWDLAGKLLTLATPSLEAFRTVTIDSYMEIAQQRIDKVVERLVAIRDRPRSERTDQKLREDFLELKRLSDALQALILAAKLHVGHVADWLKSSWNDQ